MKQLTKFILVTLAMTAASWLYFEFIISREIQGWISTIITPFYLLTALFYIIWTTSIILKFLKLDGKQTNNNK
jgi:hypothetical protein